MKNMEANRSNLSKRSEYKDFTEAAKKIIENMIAILELAPNN